MRRLTLDTEVTSNLPGVLVDNMTLFFASRLLRRNDLLTRSFGDTSGKLKDTTELAEITALATLIDSIVLWDEIYTQSDFASKWYEELPELHGFTTLIDIRPKERQQMQDSIRKLLMAQADSEHFHLYMRYIQSRDLEGAFLRSVFHYHGINAAWIKEAARHLFEKESEVKDVNFLSGSWPLGKEASTLELLGGYNGRSVIPVVATILSSGAHFFEVLGSLLGTIYLPHPFRAPFCLFDTWASRATKGVMYSPIRLLEDKRVQKAEEVNELLKDGICDLRIPVLLSTILKRCSKPEDVLEKAIEMREEPTALKFRKILNSTVEALHSGDMEYVSKSLNDLKNTIDAIGGGLEPTFRMTIGLSPGFNFEVPKDLRPFLNKHRLVFVRGVWESFAQVASIEAEMARIWGDEFAQRAVHLKKLWDWLRLDPVEISSMFERGGLA